MSEDPEHVDCRFPEPNIGKLPPRPDIIGARPLVLDVEYPPKDRARLRGHSDPDRGDPERIAGVEGEEAQGSYA